MPVQSVSYQSTIDVPRQFVWSTYLREGQFDRLVPPWQIVRTVRQEGGVRPGDFRELELAAGPLRLRWLAVHDSYRDGYFFSDRQVKGPFHVWRHGHYFLDHEESGCLIRDEIEYELPASPVTHALGQGIVRAELKRMFRYRHFTTFHDMHELWKTRAAERRTVVVEGEPAPVLRQLRSFLDIAGHEVLTGTPRTNSQDAYSILLSSAGSRQVVARITSPGGSSENESIVRSASILVPESPLLRLARAFQFFDVAEGPLTDQQFAWTTIDDFVCAVHRKLLDESPATDIHVRHRHIASFSALVEPLASGDNRVRMGRPPEALVNRCLEMLKASTMPAVDDGQIQVDSRSRYRSLGEATQTITGQV